MRVGRCIRCDKVGEIVSDGLCLKCFLEIYNMKRNEGKKPSEIERMFRTNSLYKTEETDYEYINETEDEE